VTILQAEQLTKQVAVGGAELRILDGVELSVQRGDSLAIVGASGSGKSTLLGLLAGLDLPTSGRVLLAGEDLSGCDEEQRAALRERYVGFVFQSFQLLPSLTALENVALPLELRGQRDAERDAAQFLDRVGLGERLGHYPRQLSGGEQQRVALARAFACRPEVLFADEPTGNLDTVTGRAVDELLFQLNQEHGTTLVLVTHEEGLAARCSTQLTLDAGRVVGRR